MPLGMQSAAVTSLKTADRAGSERSSLFPSFVIFCMHLYSGRGARPPKYFTPSVIYMISRLCQFGLFS